ncbi:MAG TPA: hypothetical protein VJB57_14260 [Dehalococcoidia bacterium]|nr:hypothetical protein [Dehalococcoidia bacterium]
MSSNEADQPATGPAERSGMHRPPMPMMILCPLFFLSQIFLVLFLLKKVLRLEKELSQLKKAERPA